MDRVAPFQRPSPYLMDVRLSNEQRALRDSVVQVVERLGPHSVADLDDDGRSARLDAAVVASGWRELRRATADGDPLASGVEVAIVAEELARGLADTSFLGPTLATELRRCVGERAPLATETVALTPDLSQIACVADRTDPAALVAIDAAGCESALMLVSKGEGQGVTAVGLTAPFASVDLTRSSAAVQPGRIWLTNVDGPTVADADLLRWTALGLAVTCADLVGNMRGAIELATRYAKERRQYGVAIGSFQAVQHLLADALVSMEGSRSVALHAAWAVDALSPREALSAAAVAKAYCSRAGIAVCETAIQVHGGMGNTWECPAHVHLRRALLSIDVLGGVDESVKRVLESRCLTGGHGIR
jgi:Acyl-CoA dehydrogenase, C-terminal domain